MIVYHVISIKKFMRCIKQGFLPSPVRAWETIEEADGTKLGYLVPVDAPNPDNDLLGFLDRAISMRQIETISKQMR